MSNTALVTPPRRKARGWDNTRRSIERRWRLLTARHRVLPHFLIVGEAKCGTTSLYHYLIAHPGVATPHTKEVHFFDVHWARGVDWYRSHFPLQWEQQRRPRLCGESSPYYLAHPTADRRIREVIPSAKFLVLLRNPVDRAYSHYARQVKNGETLSFSEALEAEPARLSAWQAAGGADTQDREAQLMHRKRSYFARSCYAEPLERWFSAFPREQFWIGESGAFLADPEGTMREVCAFLGLPWIPYADMAVFNQSRGRDPLEPALRSRLVDYFRPHNERLYALLGRRFDWDR